MTNSSSPDSAYISVLILQLKESVSSAEIPLLRGAVIHSLNDKLPLFHNHDGEGYRYAYPLIQYKRIAGKAALVCINHGTKEVNELLTSNPASLKLKSHEIDFNIEKITFDAHLVKIDETMISYRLKGWAPLNSANYSKYRELENMVEKVNFLENVLVGNILSFAKGVGIMFTQDVKCTITEISGSYKTKIKGVSMLCFDLLFNSNVSLPDYIGIGKHASINYGVVTHFNPQNS